MLAQALKLCVGADPQPRKRQHLVCVCVCVRACVRAQDVGVLQAENVGEKAMEQQNAGELQASQTAVELRIPDLQARLAKLDALLEEEESQDYVETMVSLLEVATQRVAIAREKYEQAGKVVEDAKRLLEEFVENVEQISKKRRTEANADLALLAARRQIAGATSFAPATPPAPATHTGTTATIAAPRMPLKEIHNLQIPVPSSASR